MYDNSITQEAKVEDIGSWEWNLLWRREWFEWEKPHVGNFLHELWSVLWM